MSWQIKLILLLALGLLLAGGWAYLERLQAENAQLKLLKDQLQTVVQDHEKNQKAWKDSTDALQKDLKTLAEVRENAQADLGKLQKLFASHDLGKLARDKPALIERRINNGTERSLLLFECTTGANRKDCPTPSEISATTTDTSDHAARRLEGVAF